MKNKILYFVILMIFAAVQFSWADGVPWRKKDQDNALNFLEKLRHEKPELFRTGDLLSKEFVCEQYEYEFGGGRVQYNFEYHFSSGWCVAKVIFYVGKNESELVDYKILKTNKSVNGYKFKFTGDEKIIEGKSVIKGNFGRKYFIKTFADGEVRKAEIESETDIKTGTLTRVRQ